MASPVPYNENPQIRRLVDELARRQAEKEAPWMVGYQPLPAPMPAGEAPAAPAVSQAQVPDPMKQAMDIEQRNTGIAENPLVRALSGWFSGTPQR